MGKDELCWLVEEAVVSSGGDFPRAPHKRPATVFSRAVRGL